MSRTLSATDIFDTVDVDLWGSKYRLRTMTRSVAERFDKAQGKLEKLPDNATNDTVVKALVAVVDVLLDPGEGGRAAGDLLLEAWEGDRLGRDWLLAFSDRLSEEIEARRRPTSQPMNGA